MGLSHWCTVVLSRPRWCTPYLHPTDHLHRDRLYLIGWNSALGSALMQGNRGGIWGGLVWPGSSLSVRPSHWHLSGLLRQGRRIQHLFWLIYPNWRETPPLGLLVSHNARAAPSATVLGWVEQATAIKHTGVSPCHVKQLSKGPKSSANYTGIQLTKIVKHGDLLVYLRQTGISSTQCRGWLHEGFHPLEVIIKLVLSPVRRDVDILVAPPPVIF